uniref:lipopolysaccharide biosynthesis protein n=1 Tax=Alistipes megaguti TaxID=2364787 RepID=UPI0013CEBA5E|nr:lipopolysaccharide biosynthesis protein [Alistipes megaguti]
MSLENNKRIAKNTIYLYIRTGVTMLVSLYTSRVVINALGLEDYGIWGVLGSIISMFGFINQSLSSSIFRYITHAIGTKDDETINRTYSASIIIHIGLAIVIFILCETLGQIFVNKSLVVPDAKRHMANVVFHLVVINSAISLLTVPFNAVIIAYERMNVYAYLTIVDTLFKLLIAAVIFWVPSDKLIWYAVMMLVITIFMLVFYYVYVRLNFTNLKFQRSRDKNLFNSLLGFSGWSLWGNLACVGYNQGLNMLLNVFFGPMVNAARSISLQIEQSVRTFVANFQTAINPQIIKNYAQNELDQMHLLMFRSTRFSFYLLLFFAIPIVLETNIILTLWLKQVPEHTIAFVRIMFAVIALEVISNSIMTGVVATGNIKKYQIVVSFILLLIVPISYVVLRLGAPAESVFIIYFIIEIFAVIARVVIAKGLIKISISQFWRHVISRSALVLIGSFVPPMVIHIFLQEGLIRFFAVLVVGCLSTVFAIYLLGLNAREKELIISALRKKFHL